jgi:hypothetical protein
MKKTFTLAVLFLTTLFAFAQNDQASASGKPAYSKGDKIFQAGIGFGAYSYGFSRQGGIPPLTASVEVGLHDHISVGPYVGFTGWNYKSTHFKSSYNYTAVGGRGSFHYLPFLNKAFDLGINEQKFDFYATLFLGLEFRRLSSKYEDPDFEEYNSSSTTVGLRLAPVLGFKYKFNDKFGVYLEGGRGALSAATLGVSVNF